MKNFFASLPSDIKQTLSSLAVAVALLCGSLFMLSAYMDTLRAKDADIEAMAEVTAEESSEESD